MKSKVEVRVAAVKEGNASEPYVAEKFEARKV